MKLNEIEKDEDIYPRQQISQKTIESYVESIKAGAKFPPIEVQKITQNQDLNKIKIICLDGWHRLEAYREYNKIENVSSIEDVEVTFWKDEVLDKQQHLNDLRLESALKNILHGDRLSLKDREFQARRIIELNPKIENRFLADKLGVSEWTMSQWVSSIRTKYYASRDSLIYKLSLLGWTQQEIGTLVEITQPEVSENITKFSKLKTVIISDFYDKHKSIEEICQYYQIDEPLAWAIILEGKSDLERFDLFGKAEYQNESPMLYNIWNFGDRDKRLGEEATGNIAGQIVMNLLYYFTKQGDLVVDPMAGGGSTIDACLILNRRCKAYDEKSQRKDITEYDLLNGVPQKATNCDFIFLDPPYYNMVFDLFQGIDDFYHFIDYLADYSLLALKSNGIVAVLMQDMTEKGNYCLSGETYHIFLKKGLNYIAHISCPLSTEQFLPQQVEKSKKEKHLLGRNRDLYIFRKE